MDERAEALGEWRIILQQDIAPDADAIIMIRGNVSKAAIERLHNRIDRLFDFYEEPTTTEATQ